MRKLNIFLMFFLLFSCFANFDFNPVSATYYGEEPYVDDGYYYIEFYESGQFVFPSSTLTDVEVLVVGGGGSGGYVGGGGGAGGLILMDGNNSYEFNATELSNGYVTVTIGAGGVATDTTIRVGNNGGNSSFGHLTAIGGGGGGGWGTGGVPGFGLNGGSGGGATTAFYASEYLGGTALQTSASGDSGTYGHGYDAGDSGVGSGYVRSTGGGGAGGASNGLEDYVNAHAGTIGGVGLQIWDVWYAGGGSGYYQGSKSNGGGGAQNESGSANTGGGGGGWGSGTITGGSGIVVIRYLIPEIPSFTYPDEGQTYNELKVPIAWESMDDVDYYEIKWDDNSSFSSYSSGTYTDTNTIIYLSNATWYFDIRAKLNDGNFTPWLTDYYDPLSFTKDDKPVFSLPSGDEVSAQVNFEWSEIGGVTEYEFKIYTNVGLTELYANSSVYDNTHTETLVNDDYWAIVRGKDNFYTGAWSDAVDFNLLIAEIPFEATPNTVNLYVGDTLQYDITGMDENVTYTFKINRIDDSGTFVSNITTKTLVGDADGNESFSYVFPANSFYPFEVRYNESNARLYTHYVAPRPTSLYLFDILGHRTSWGGNVMSVAIGNVAYNNWTGPLHDATNSIESLYETDDYVLLHYSLLPTDVNISSVIDIMNMDTGIVYLSIDSDDLHDYQSADTNFIIIPLNGVQPSIIDSNLTLPSYRANNWTGDAIFTKGAYDYAQYVVDADEYIDLWYGGGWENGDDIAISYGESVMLVGDSSTIEWSVTPSTSSIVSGKEITWTITCNTEKIWDIYNQMYFRDKSSDSYYIGSAGSLETYPSAYASSFIIKYIIESGIGGCIYRVGPGETNFDTNLVNYDYVFDKSVVITDPVDNTLILIDLLETFGFGSTNGKLMFSMIMIIILAIVCAILGIPASIIAMIVMAFAVIMTSLGFIPIWVIVIIGLAMILLLIRAFTGGGGGDE